MRYSYEYKRKCVELYREGKWPETPEWVKDPNRLHRIIAYDSVQKDKKD